MNRFFALIAVAAVTASSGCTSLKTSGWLSSQSTHVTQSQPAPQPEILRTSWQGNSYGNCSGCYCNSNECGCGSEPGCGCNNPGCCGCNSGCVCCGPGPDYCGFCNRYRGCGCGAYSTAWSTEPCVACWTVTTRTIGMISHRDRRSHKPPTLTTRFTDHVTSC